MTDTPDTASPGTPSAALPDKPSETPPAAPSSRHRATRLLHTGRAPAANHGIVNPPVYHASTILFADVAAMEEAERTPFQGTRYGRWGTPTSFALEDAVSELEGGFRTVLVPSGLAAITVSLMAFLRAGDHLLMVDAAYSPARRFCDQMLAQLGIETTYFDPLADVAPLLRPNTKVVYLESPGSLTFEVQDVPRAAAAARAAGAVSIIDNTYAAGVLFRPLEHGVDVSLQSATKYLGGHADAVMGTITAKSEEHWLAVRKAAGLLGTAVGPDDCYLMLRGLRTLETRLARHEQTAHAVTAYLQNRPEVTHVVHPGLPGCPGHANWQRDFTGINGLLSIVLDGVGKPALTAMLDGLRLFRLGYSWGGYESLIVPFDPRRTIRSATHWPHGAPCVRLHCGLEHVDDLIADLESGFARLNTSV